MRRRWSRSPRATTDLARWGPPAVSMGTRAHGRGKALTGRSGHGRSARRGPRDRAQPWWCPMPPSSALLSLSRPCDRQTSACRGRLGRRGPTWCLAHGARAPSARQGRNRTSCRTAGPQLSASWP
eukprot:5573653-Alexandrium_andersonii.AAC.1